MKIGVLGGTFNPIHDAHLAMATAARDVFGLDRVLLMVAADPPHKSMAGQAGAEARLTMVQLACSGVRGVEACDLELRRKGKSYTADTLAALSEQMPGAELSFIMGSDMLHDLSNWYKADEVMARARILYVPRAGQEAGDYEAAETLKGRYRASILPLYAPVEELSSTEIRRRLHAALPVDGMMPPAALIYAFENGLYFPEPLKAALKRLRASLPEKRYRHSAGCAICALRLAEGWGADGEKTRLAALLHDCAKTLSPRELFLYSGDDTDILAVQHAFAGAVVAKTVYGVTDDEVLRAIRRHCTGERGMGLIDKIVYLADMIEPTRDFEGVETLRKSVQEGADAAMLTALTRSEARLEAGTGNIHPATLRAIQYFKDITKEEKD